MFRRILLALALVVIVSVPASHIMRAACNGVDNQDNTFDENGSDPCGGGGIYGGFKTTNAPDPMTNTLTNDTHSSNIDGGNNSSATGGTLINDMINNGNIDNDMMGGSVSGPGDIINNITNNDEVGGTLYGGENDGSGTKTSTILNLSSSSHVGGSLNGGANNDTGTTNTIIINQGTVDSDMHGSNNTGTYGTVTNTLENDGSVAGYVLLGNNSADNATMTNTFTNNGEAGEVDGGETYNPYSTMTNTITNTAQGTISLSVYGGKNTAPNSTETNTINNAGYAATIYGGDNTSTGTQKNVINITGNVGGDVVGGTNSGGGHQTNLITLSGDGPTITGTIYGSLDNNADSSTLVFQFSTSNEGDYDSFLSQFAAAHPEGGEITWGGHTYSWLNFTDLQNLVKFILKVTWFDPGDNRVDPKAGDHIAAYCNIKDGTVGVYIINGDSVGQALTSFAIGDLRSAGAAGIFHNLGVEGIVSLSVDSQNNFWLAWNGGPLNANGQGDFAKGFTCAFPS